MMNSLGWRRRTTVNAVFWVGAALVAMMLLGLTADAYAQVRTVPPPASSHIVVLKSGASPANVAASHSLVLGQTYGTALHGFAAQVPEGRVRALSLDPRVASVEVNAVFQLDAQTLTNGIRRVGADQNPLADIDGVDDARVDAVVAVLDSGVDGTHAELNVNATKSADCTSAGGCAVGVAFDGNGHGTHVAGTIGAIDNGTGVVGVAPGAEIWSVRVCGPSGSCALSDILAGHDYISANAASINVVNVSLGGRGWSDAWRAAIADNVNRGVVVIVAAGNSSADIYGGDGAIGGGDEFIPASFPEASAISALADSDGLPGGLGADTAYGIDDSVATFSNFAAGSLAGNPVSSSGGGIDLAAPGVEVLSTYPGDRYAIMSGTSMAAPHAAGAAALHIAQYGRANDANGVYAIRQALIDASEPMSSWRADGGDIGSDPDGHHEGAVVVSTAGPPTTDPAPPPEPSFEDVAVVGFSAPTTATEGVGYSLLVTARNEGSSAQSVALDIVDAADGSLVGTVTQTLAAGEQVTTTFEWIPTVGGPLGAHELTASATAIADDDRANDVATAVVEVEAAATADLIVDVAANVVAIKQHTAIEVEGSVVRASGGAESAFVTVVLSTPSGKIRTAETTTTNDGTYLVSFRLNPKRDGCGTFDVSVEALAGSNNGSGTTSVAPC